MEVKNVIKNEEENNTKKEFIGPMVFVNNPISDEGQDVLGIGTYADRINQALDEGANIIGVIGDYGTGKSSLIELIKKKHKDSININMWGNDKKDGEKNKIRALTKNFLFQMSMGKDETFAKYINKKLSKSYGLLSIVLSDKEILDKLYFPGVLFLIYLLLNTMPGNIYDSSMYLNLHNIVDFTNHEALKKFIIIVYTVIINLKIPILGASVYMVVKLLLDKSILFSLWNSQGKREPNENDLYDLYIEIANKLTENLNNGEKRIIVVDDLDRANNKNDVKDFIKEIYKFNSVLKDEVKSKIAFIFEVKSEESLEDLEYVQDVIEKNEYKKELYKKVFYFKVNLNPIHYNDFELILKQMLNKKFNEKIIFGKNIDEELPEEFSYIIKGENLTIRDIKERLNRSFEIYENLMKKSNGVSDTIQYQKCALVAYLESKYPLEMLKFIKEEQEFNKILEEAYMYKQENVPILEKIQNIKSLILGYNDEFSIEIAEMIANDLIDEDFRLYFYNYPIYQKIKTSDEIYVEKIILYPRKIKEIDNEKIKNAIKKDKNVVYKYLERRISLGLLLDKKILENEILYGMALKRFYPNVLESLKEEVKWGMFYADDSCEIIRKINNYKVNSEKLLSEYVLAVKEDFKELSKEEIIYAREKIIEATQSKYILCFRDIFVNSKIPLITENELKIINSMDKRLTLINEKAINSRNVKYILKIINEKKLSEKNFYKALRIYRKVCINLNMESLSHYILEFLSKNNKINDFLFRRISETFRNDRTSISEKMIVDYLNNLDENRMSEVYLECIELMRLKEQLSDNILNLLRKHEYFETIWINLIKQHRCNELELVNGVKENLKIIKNIYPIIGDDIIFLRKEIIKQRLYLQYESLFFKPYPDISKWEINFSESFKQMNKLINFSSIKDKEMKYMLDKINNMNSISKK